MDFDIETVSDVFKQLDMKAEKDLDAVKQSIHDDSKIVKEKIYPENE